MTQEELDALMNGDTEVLKKIDEGEEIDIKKEREKVAKPDPAHHDGIYPPPATPEHKVVSQLDEVTKDSEEKATEILDIMEQISNAMMENEENSNVVLSILKEEKEILEALTEKFPRVEIFKTQLEKINNSIELLNKNLENARTAEDNILIAMDIMQFQDIHRQKIERVINIMRELLKYMNRIFECKVDDTKRASSARHLHGDKTDDLIEEDDLDALIAKFANGGKGDK